MDHSLTQSEQIEQPSLPMKPKRVSLYAGFWMRFWAYLLDMIVIWSLVMLFIHPTFRWFHIPLTDDGMFTIKGILSTILFYGYFVLMTRFFGQTIGKMVFAIRVVSKGLDESMTWSTLLFREVIGRFISKVLFIGYIITAFTNEKKALHDIFADTRVIHSKK